MPIPVIKDGKPLLLESGVPALCSPGGCCDANCEDVVTRTFGCVSVDPIANCDGYLEDTPLGEVSITIGTITWIRNFPLPCDDLDELSGTYILSQDLGGNPPGTHTASYGIDKNTSCAPNYRISVTIVCNETGQGPEMRINGSILGSVPGSSISTAKYGLFTRNRFKAGGSFVLDQYIDFGPGRGFDHTMSVTF